MISRKSIQEVYDTVKVEDVVGDYVNLKRRGVNMLGLCPFHDEKTPSFTVSPSKNIYKCFGCGQGGDAVNFLMEHESFSYVEAIRHLARKYGIKLEETEATPEEVQSKLLSESYYIINDYAKKYFTSKLLDDAEGRGIGLAYFKERGFLEETIRKFDLGYADNEYKSFTEEAIRKRYNVEHLKTLGLTSKNGYDFFRSRVMFTIHNLSGKVIAFAGRILTSDKKSPKYINSPESEIYNKRKILYGIYQAKTAIRKHDECIIVEGYTDVLSLHQNGVENVVASSGTSLTDGQIKLIKRFTNNVKIIYDGDDAGMKAALRGLDKVLAHDMNVKLILLPKGEDPDSYVRKMGHERFSEYLKSEAQDFVIFKTNLLLDEAGNDPIARSNVIKTIVESISMISDMLKRSVYIKECSRLLGVSEDVIVKAANKMIRTRIQDEQRKKERESLREERLSDAEVVTETKQAKGQQDITVSSGDSYQERELVRLLLIHGNKEYQDYDNVHSYIFLNIASVIDTVEHPNYKEMIEIMHKQSQEDKNIDANYFLTHQNNAFMKIAIDLMADPYTYADWEGKDMYLQSQKMPEENQLRTAESTLKYFLMRKLNKKITEFEELIRTKSSDPEVDMALLLGTLIKLKTQRNDIADSLGMVTFNA